MSADALIRKLNLLPHPEGGWYRELYRSAAQVETSRGRRSAVTTIFYLLERHQHSRWHVVDSDEIWHFHAGAPLELLAYVPDSGEFRSRVLDQPGGSGHPVAIIEAGVWQAARSLGDCSLVGCSVAPGFEFSDFRFVSTLSDHQSHFTGVLAAYSGLL